MSARTLFETAIAEVANLEPGETFKVKDLFRGYEWNRFSLNDRRSLGRNFCDSSMNPLLEEGVIVALGKTDSGQQVYKKQ